jgi:hypothetical protein
MYAAGLHEALAVLDNHANMEASLGYAATVTDLIFLLSAVGVFGHRPRYGKETVCGQS